MSHYLILSFTYRKGNVYRQDKEEFSVDRTSSSLAEVLSRVRRFAARGEQALVFENGHIKSDWSRLNQKGFESIMRMRDDSVKRLFANTVMPIELEFFVSQTFHAFPNLSRQLPLSFMPVKPEVKNPMAEWPIETRS